MSDVSAADATVGATDAIPTPELLSAGAMLRRAREAAGLHVAALAVTMKVPVKKLEALENDRLDLLPDAVFVRALASSVCRTLKIEAGPILAKLPQNAPPKLDTEERGINAPFHAPGETRQWTVPEFLTRPAVLAVLGLLLAAVVLVLIPSSPTETAKDVPVSAAPAPAAAPLFPPGETPPGVAAPQAVAPAATPTTPQTSAVVTTTPTNMPAVASTPVKTTAIATPAAAPSVAPTSTQPSTPTTASATASPSTSSATPAATNTPPIPNAGILNFHSKGTSWVEVRDANGVTQLRKTLYNGESVATGGALPLSVVVGRADVTTVEVRGKPFSLTAVSADNVARFEVK